MRRRPFSLPNGRPVRRPRRPRLRIETLEARDVPAAISWDGGAGTTDWIDALNWSGDVLPTAADDVTVDSGGSTVSLAGTNVTVKSLDLSNSLEVLGTAGLTVSNGFTLAATDSLTVDGASATFTASGTTNIDGASLYAFNGGQLALPGLTNFTHTGGASYPVIFQATGTGSLLDLSALTDITGSPESFSRVEVTALSGATVDLSQMITVTDPPGDTIGRTYTFEADGPGSLIDLSALTGLNDIDGYRGVSTLSATAGGEVRVPLITSLANTAIVIDGATSILPISQITSIVDGGIVVAGAGNVRSFPLLTNVDGSALSASGGGQFSLPAVATYTNTGTGYYGSLITGFAAPVLGADGANSLLDLPALTTMTGATLEFSALGMLATDGGVVQAPLLTQINDPTGGNTIGRSLSLEADGANSLLDLPALTTFHDVDGYRATSAITVTAGGEVRIPLVTSLTNTGITIDGASSILPINQITSVVDGGIVIVGAGNVRLFPNLTNADGSTLSAQSGGHLTLPVLATYTNTGTGYFGSLITGFAEPLLTADSANSILMLPALTQVTSAQLPWCSVTVQATGGGQVQAPALLRIDDSPTGDTTGRAVYVQANDAGSLVNMSALTAFTDQTGYRAISTLNVTNGGEVRVPNLTALSAVYVTIDGANSILLTNQFTSVTDGAIEVDGAANVRTFPKLTNADGSSFIASGDGRLTLPILLGYTATGNGYAIDTYFGEAAFRTDTGGALDLPVLSSIRLTTGYLTMSVPPLTLHSLTISDGTLYGDTPITVTDDFTWMAGYLRATAPIQLTTTATGHISDVGYKYLDQAIENAGSLTFDGTNFFFGWNASEAGQIVNHTGGTFTLAGSGAVEVYNPNAGHAIINEGALVRVGGGTTQINVPVNNTGTIDVRGGTLDLAGGGTVTFDDPQVLSTRTGATLVMPTSLGGTTKSAGPFAPLGTLTFSGGTAGAPLTWEAMGRDLGAVASGFIDNFTYGTVTLSAAYVRLADMADNAPGTEALYVDTLVIPVGSTLDLNGIPLYARATQIDGTVIGSVSVLPDGGPIALGTPTAGSISAASEVDDWTITARAGQSLYIVVDPGNNPPPPVAPTLDYVQVQVLDTLGGTIASGNSATAGEVVALPIGPLLVDGTYHIHIAAAAPATTGHYRLALYDASVTTRPLTLNERTIGDTHSPYATERWTFSAAANQAVQFDLLGSASAGMRFSLNGPNGFVGFVDLADDSGPVVLTETGVYTLDASSQGSEAGAYTFAVDLVSQAVLTPGDSFTGPLAGTGFAQLFEVDVTAAGPLAIGLDVVDSNARTEIYARLGTPPTRGRFDYTSADGPGADHTLLVPFAAPGKWYVLVYGAAVPGPSDFTISADSQALVLNTSIPSSAPTGLVANLTLTGAGFVPGTQVDLVSGATTYPATAVAIDSIARVTAGFDLTTIPVGTYDVRVTLPGGATRTLSAAFHVVAPGQPQFTTNVVIPNFLGRHATATLYVEYANLGAAPMAAPVLTFQSADADSSDRPLLTLDQSRVVEGFWTSAYPDGFSSSVQILASGATPGILGPGEHVRVPVYYAGLVQPWSLTDSTIEFEVQVHEAGDPTLIDWASLQTSLKPAFIAADAWAGVYASLQTIVGSTWGDYVRTLGANAAYLDRLGQSVTDVAQLWAFEIQQAIGLPAVTTLAAATDAAMPTPGLALSFGRSFGNTITERYQVGPFGRGWSAPWQTSLAQLTDGTIVVTGSADTQLRFQPDSRTPGAYFVQAGNPDMFRAVAGGYELTNPDGRLTRFRADGTLEYVQDTNGNRITTTFTAGRLTALTHSSGASLAIAYNGAGLIGSIADSAGRVTSYSYDATNSHLMSATGPGGTTTYQYDPGTNPALRHALTSVTDPSGVTRTFTYDALGRLATAARTGGAELITYTYANGQVTATDGGGVATKLFFDQHRLLVRTEDGTGSYTRYDYDDQRRPIRVTDALGRSQSFSYTATGAPLVRTDVYGHTATFVPGGPDNNPAAFKDANSQLTQFSYDAAGNRTITTYPDGTVETATFDALGDPIRLVNRRGQITTRTFNTAGQLLTETFPDAPAVTYSYDTRGRLATASDTAGTTTFTYDTADRLTRVDYPLSRWITYAYDAAGRRTRMEDSTGFVVQYAYDAAGRLKQLQDSVGTPLVTYTYDAAGRLSRVDKANGTYTLNTVDTAGRPATVTNHAPDNSVVSSFVYAYDPAGRRTGAQTLDGSWTYGYDLSGQLVQATFTSTGLVPNQDLHYEYDAAGNRTRTILNGATADYTTNNLDQYTAAGATAYQYDLDGNVVSETGPGGTKTFAYDARNRLVHAVSGPDTWTYSYDAFGNRIASTHNGQSTAYLVDPTGAGSVLAEATGPGPTTHYLYGNGLAGRSDATGTAYFNFDATGSTSELTGTGGVLLGQYVYDPFGTVIAATSSDPNAFRFGGQYGLPTDATGLVFMRARYYDPVSGRFNSVDPLRLATGDPNLYRYASNSPAEFADPTGRATTDPTDGQIDRLPPPGTDPAPGPTDPLPGPDPVPPPADPGPGWHDDPPPAPNPGTEDGFFDPPPSDGPEVIENTDVLPPPPPPPPPPPSFGGWSGATGAATSTDPNEKLGPIGYGPQRFVGAGALLSYDIKFENRGPGSVPTPAHPATAPAQRVEITDQLSTDFDWSTFRFGAFGFGDTVVTVPTSRQAFSTTVPFTYNGQTFDVNVDMGFDPATGLIRVVFQSVDAKTSLPPDVLTGFLPPEDGTGRGQGHLAYTVQPKAGLSTGTVLKNIADIRFDGQPAIATNQIDPDDPSAGTDPTKEARNTIDASAPTSRLNPLPRLTTTTSIPLYWSGSDAIGAGLAGFDVYVGTDGAPAVRWLSNTTARMAVYNGVAGHRYDFFTVARDYAGNEESLPLSPQATTVVADLPAARDDAFTFKTSKKLSVSAGAGLLKNDVFTGAKKKLTVELVAGAGPTHGTLDLKTTGSFTYLADVGYNGRDSFTYKVKDALGHYGNPARVDLSPNLVSFKAATVKASEKGPAKLTFTLAHPATTATTVGYRIAPQSAGDQGQDFTLADGTVTFAAGKKTTTLVVPLTNDTFYEGTEAFQVWLLDPGGDTAIGRYEVVTVSILDDEKPPAVSFRTKAAHGAEGTQASIEVFLSAVSALPVTIDFAFKARGSTATPGSDFTLAAGTLTFAPGQMSKTIDVPIIDDALVDPNEKFVLVLSKPTGAKLKGITATTFTIDDNDP